MDAPLSLSNLLTVIMAVTCLSTMIGQSRGTALKPWRLAVPAALASAQALVLLAGVFDASFMHDAVWVLAAALGSILGRARGWSMRLAVDHTRGLAQLRRSIDGQLAAIALVALSLLDFTSAALDVPLTPPANVAAVAAFFAGYIVCRAIAIGVRVSRSPHAELGGQHVSG